MDKHTHEDIDKRVRKLIKEMGVREPPLDMDAVVAHLEIDQQFYDINDPTLLEGLFHKMKLGAFKVKGVLKKVGMQGLWLPHESKIMIDAALPKPKHKWVTAHEVGHRLIPTHRHFLFGDTAETLDPEYHDMLEQEAQLLCFRTDLHGEKVHDGCARYDSKLGKHPMPEDSIQDQLDLDLATLRRTFPQPANAGHRECSTLEKFRRRCESLPLLRSLTPIQDEV